MNTEPTSPPPLTVPELTTLLILVEEDVARLEGRAGGHTTYTSRQMRGLADRVRSHLDATLRNQSQDTQS